MQKYYEFLGSNKQCFLIILLNFIQISLEILLIVFHHYHNILPFMNDTQIYTLAKSDVLNCPINIYKMYQYNNHMIQLKIAITFLLFSIAFHIGVIYKTISKFNGLIDLQNIGWRILKGLDYSMVYLMKMLNIFFSLVYFAYILKLYLWFDISNCNSKNILSYFSNYTIILITALIQQFFNINQIVLYLIYNRRQKKMEQQSLEEIMNRQLYFYNKNGNQSLRQKRPSLNYARNQSIEKWTTIKILLNGNYLIEDQINTISTNYIYDKEYQQYQLLEQQILKEIRTVNFYDPDFQFQRSTIDICFQSSSSQKQVLQEQLAQKKQQQKQQQIQQPQQNIDQNYLTTMLINKNKMSQQQ